MAIRFDILEAPGFANAASDKMPVLRFPLNTSQQLVAAGESAEFAATTRAVMLKNTGDEVFVFIRDKDSSTNAGAAVAGSFTLDTGESLVFGCQGDSGLAVDIRATA